MSNVGYATLQIIPSAKGFESALAAETDVGSAKAGASGGKQFGGSFISPLKGLAGPIAAAFGGAAIGSFLKGTIGLASDLSETVNKSNVIFGASAGTINKWAEGSVKALGISKSEALATAAQFGDMFKQMSLGAPQVASMSENFLKLSADIGSFQNAETGDVTNAFQSALRGEYESLQHFLPAINATRVANEALAETHKKNVKELTGAEKATALYALATKDGASASNDFAETQGGLAGQQKIAAANMENLKAKIGSALLPAFNTALTAVNGLFSGFGPLVHMLGDVLGPVIDTVGGVFDDFVKGLQGVGPATDGVFTIVRQIGLGFSAFWAALKEGDVTSNGLVGKFEVMGDALHRVGIFVQTEAIPAFQTFMATLQANVVPVLMSLWGVIQNQVIPTVQTMAGIFVTSVLPVIVEVAQFVVTSLVPAVMKIVTSVATSLMPVITALWQTFRTNLLPAIQSGYEKFQTLLPTIEKIITVVVSVTGFLLKLAAAILGTVLPPLISFAGFLIGTVFKVITSVIGVIVTIIGKVVDFGVALFNIGAKAVGFASSIWDAITKVVGYFMGLPGRIASATSGLFDGVKDSFRSAINWIIDKWNNFHLTIGGGSILGQDLPSVTLNTPNIPHLAMGGIVPKTPGGRLVLVGEGRESEAVIPLSKLSSLSADHGEGYAPAIVEAVEGLGREIRRQTDRGLQLTRTGAAH